MAYEYQSTPEFEAVLNDRGFRECMAQCLNRESFIKEYNRLTGQNFQIKITPPKSPIEQMIDKACGIESVKLNNSVQVNDIAELQPITHFVYTFVYLPLINQFNAQDHA